MKLVIRYIGGFIVCCSVLLSVQMIITFGIQESITHAHLYLPKRNKVSYGNGTVNISTDKFRNKVAYKNRTVKISAEEFRTIQNLKTGNALIDEYGKNDPYREGENGTGVIISHEEENRVNLVIRKHQINIFASDKIPLNRKVPDSRPTSCQQKRYPDDLPKTSIIIPFFDEWPSVLKRTIYSIVNRTPRYLVQEIILVDDNSQMAELKSNLDDYIKDQFPAGLVKLIHSPTREGLVNARLRGWRASVGEVVVFFDSHMEVNVDWLQPLLTAIKNDRKTIAMGMLDYIQYRTFKYNFREGYFTRYGFDWRLIFFETYFRPDQIGPALVDPRPGVVMVGPAFAVDRKYFGEIGAYDSGMKIWGGENLEFPWRVWMCGGQLLHFPCSRIGHIARHQPYSFPDGRHKTEAYNYKRAVEVWMEPKHKRIIYDHFPDMRELAVGDLTERLKIKAKLNCKNFTWFMHTIWPELAVYEEDALAWGSIRNINRDRCLDNYDYLFQAPVGLHEKACTHKLAAQGFSWTKDKLLKTSLSCVVIKEIHTGAKPMIEDCIMGQRDQWEHKKHSYLKHVKTGLCLDYYGGGLIMNMCSPFAITQRWSFKYYNI